MYQGLFPLGVKQLGCEADHSPPCCVKVKECMELYLHLPIHLHGMVLRKKKHRDNFVFTLHH
jgi:hypothetical protein